MGQVAHGPYKPGTWACNPHIKDFDYNPDRAKQLLAEAGWKETNSDGILVKDGKPFQFTILTNQGNAERLKDRADNPAAPEEDRHRREDPG